MDEVKLSDIKAVNDKASKKHQSEEPYQYNIQTFAGKLLSTVDQLHVWHWQTKSEALHTALGELYDYVEDFADSIVEKYMSDGPVVTGISICQPVDFTGGAQVQGYLTELAACVNKHKDECERPDLQRLLDKLVAEIHQYKYKFTLE